MGTFLRLFIKCLNASTTNCYLQEGGCTSIYRPLSYPFRSLQTIADKPNMTITDIRHPYFSESINIIWNKDDVSFQGREALDPLRVEQDPG